MVNYKSFSLFLLPQELPRFKELIFEDFSRFLLVENMFEELVLQSVSKDIMMGEGQKPYDLEMMAAVVVHYQAFSFTKQLILLFSLFVQL